MWYITWGITVKFFILDIHYTFNLPSTEFFSELWLYSHLNFKFLEYRLLLKHISFKFWCCSRFIKNLQYIFNKKLLYFQCGLTLSKVLFFWWKITDWFNLIKVQLSVTCRIFIMIYVIWFHAKVLTGLILKQLRETWSS